jgi:transposase-like protein
LPRCSRRRGSAAARALHAQLPRLCDEGSAQHGRCNTAAIRTVFTQEVAAAGATAWRHVADQLRPRFPKLAALMDEAETDVLSFMSFPRAHWPKLHSTNPLERLNKEVKRRANVVGIFPNEASVKRLVGAILLEQNDEWQLQHRYMTLETMTGLSDDPIGNLPNYAIKAA